MPRKQNGFYNCPESTWSPHHGKIKGSQRAEIVRSVIYLFPTPWDLLPFGFCLQKYSGAMAGVFWRQNSPAFAVLPSETVPLRKLVLTHMAFQSSLQAVLCQTKLRSCVENVYKSVSSFWNHSEPCRGGLLKKKTKPNTYNILIFLYIYLSIYIS